VTGDFIHLVLLVDGFPSLPFSYIWGFSSFVLVRDLDMEKETSVGQLLETGTDP
jgi:hypothetical protein